MSAALPASLNRVLARRRHAAQWRAAVAIVMVVMPAALGAAALADAIGGPIAATVIAVITLVGTAMAAVRQARRFDHAWLARQLDAASATLEDSSALALSTQTPASPLQQLQQTRMRQRLEAQLADHSALALGAPLPWQGVKRSIGIGLLLLASALLLPVLRTAWAAQARGSVEASKVSDGKIDAEIIVTPPAYTGLGRQKLMSLDAKAPVDSRLAWTLTLDRDATAVTLVFQDGDRLPLRGAGRVWKGERVLSASALYRVEIDGAEPFAGTRASRLDAIADAPPEVIVRQPEKTLTLLTADQKTWSLAFEARDAYGLGEAALTITLAQGSGDNIKTTEQRIVLDGSGDTRSRRYDKKLDLTALGFAKGDDLIVKLSVADNHPPQPNVSNSASFILRWPPEKSAESEGMEGIVQKTLPAYFRSERQIIIDTEALIAKRASLAANAVEKQSDELGVDQKVLRLRYGQFLGEGFETSGEKAPQDDHADAHAKDDTLPAGASESLKQLPNDGDHAVSDSPANKSVMGRDEDVLHEFGHAHDNAEATTLLDPETRRILKAALDEMWQAELNLRQAQPDLALPFEYKALDYIKQVQQAERIYLARAGLELPQVDAARRLTGKREGLSDRSQTLPAPEASDSPVPALWSALNRGDAIHAATLGAWVRSHPDAVKDAQGLLAAADRVEHEPACAECRTELKGRLWPLLPLPPTAVLPRVAPDAAGAAYLEALTAAPAGTAP
jgi:hypothetical protein